MPKCHLIIIWVQHKWCHLELRGSLKISLTVSGYLHEIYTELKLYRNCPDYKYTHQTRTGPEAKYIIIVSVQLQLSTWWWHSQGCSQQWEHLWQPSEWEEYWALPRYPEYLLPFYGKQSAGKAERACAEQPECHTRWVAESDQQFGRSAQPPSGE